MPFSKGDPNINRKGRPKGISITEMVKEALEETEDKTGKPWKELIIRRILLKATNDGDTTMLKAIWAYIDGMPKQHIDHTSKDQKINIDDPQILTTLLKTAQAVVDNDSDNDTTPPEQD